jgi:hypothetical protein
MWKDTAMAQFEVLSWNLPGGIEEDQEHPHVGWLVMGPRFEPEIFRIGTMSTNDSAATADLWF